MNITRRAFLAGLGTMAAAFVLPSVPIAETANTDTQIMSSVPKMAHGDWSMILHKGDIITFEGIYAVNPKTKSKTKYLKQFVVTDISKSGEISIL